MPANSKNAATKIMQSMLESTIPEITDNVITVPFVKDGTVAFNNLKQKFTITSEALENGHKTWKGGIVTVNHKVKEQGLISKTWYEKPFAYAEITGLSDEAMSIVQSPAYRGVSQESKSITSDNEGNVTKLKGTGITLVMYPETPACNLTAGCGALINSALIDTEENEYVKFDVAVRNNVGNLVKIRDDSIYIEPNDRMDDEDFKQRIANTVNYIGLGTFYIFNHNQDINIGDEMLNIEPLHTVEITVSMLESNPNINTDESKLDTMSTRGTETMTDKTDESALEALKVKHEDALKTKSMAYDSELATKDTEIADLKSQIVTIKEQTDKEVADLKSTIEKTNNDMPTVIKSALEAHDDANAKKLAYDASVTELNSVMKEDLAKEFLKTEPNTAQIMSMVNALKSANPAEVGVGTGADPDHSDDAIKSTLTEMGIPSIDFKVGA